MDVLESERVTLAEKKVIETEIKILKSIIT